VAVELSLDPAGAVREARVVRSSGFEEFDDAALAAARAGEYQPARVDGVAVASTIRFTVRFRLRE
jgi:TonB family protein